MSLKIKELPEAERPYEKLELHGEKRLSNAELLAIIIKTGTREETSVQVAQKLLKLNYDPQMGELNFIQSLTLQELMQIKGIGKVKAIQLKAVCELAKRMCKPSNYKKVQVNSTNELADILMTELRFEKKEIVKLVILNNRNEILNMLDIATGGVGFVNVEIKEILGEAIKIKAPKIILVHNHPSGDSTPSEADIKFTDKLYNAAKVFDIELLDHIVIGNMNFTSVFTEVEKIVKNVKKDIK